MTQKKPTSGFTCSTCGQYHNFALYVLVNWDTPLTHNCRCGAVHYVLRGKVQQMKEGQK